MQIPCIIKRRYFKKEVYVVYKIVKKQTLNQAVELMEIHAPYVARKCEPGQFIIIRVDEDGERVPLTIADYDREKETVTIIYQVVGYTTELLDVYKRQPMNISEVTVENEERIPTGIHELDRVLGGGIVKGSLSLVGGDPGIGKSTLLLQVCRNLANSKRKVLYISGEESMHQIKMRAERIGTFEEEMLLYCETDLDAITNAILKTKPEFAVIDSIQTKMCIRDRNHFHLSGS